MITAESIKRFAPNARADLVAAIVAGWPTMQAEGIDTPLRVAHFMAQIATETGGFTQLEENLNYTARRLMQVWPSRFKTLAAAKPFERNPRALANKVYGSRLGNRAGTDDGWNYRGGGFMQETGRANYRARGAELDLPLEAHPELLRDPKTAFLAAVASWAARDCNPLADRDDVTAVRKAINGGTNGLDECRKWLKRAKQVWKPGLVVARPVGLLAMAEAEDAVPAVDPDTLPPVEDVPQDRAYPKAVIEAVQRHLSDMGYWTGPIDGNPGGGTYGSVAAFMVDRTAGAIKDGSLNDASLAEIEAAHNEGFKRPISEARKNATPHEVREVAPEAKASFRSKIAGFGTAIVAGFYSVTDWIADNFMDAADKLGPVRGFFASVPIWAYGLAVAGVALFIGYQSKRSESKIVEAYQERRLL